MIKIEDQILKSMYTAKIFKTNADPKKMRSIVEAIIRQQYPNSVLVNSEQLKKIEKFSLFQKTGKTFPMSYLVFDSEHMKIIGIEFIKK
jgi:hypothetical protein